MSVAGSPRRSPSCRWRKRHRPGADWWGPPVRFIVDQGCGYLFTCVVFSFWLLFSGVWETLIFGTGDWFAFGEPFFCGLFTPTYPLPGHRIVPESQYIHIYIYMFVDSLSRDCIENRILSFNFANRAIRHPYTRRDVLNGCDTSQSAVLPWWLWPCTYHAASAKFAVLVPL